MRLLKPANRNHPEYTQGAAISAAPSISPDKLCYSEGKTMHSLLRGSRTYNFPDTDVILAERDFPYVLRVRDLADDARPREKLARQGPHDLSLAELVAVLLGVGTRREEVLTMARRILKEYGERAIMHETDPKRLAESLDIPFAKACQLVASFEIGRRFYENRAGKPVVVRTARQAYEHLKGMAGLQKEQLRALYLNSRYHVIHEEVVSVGSLTANIVHPREVFQPAIQYGAVGVIIAHNHPSGSTEPTGADLDVTRQLLQGGQLLGIELLDHLIITADTFISIIGDTDE
ncbi:MAG TPA: DNA repair protein RadC [Candidatus Saccharimonadales bacterium]|nr:DNA repair protein RadC [Candidatus Saccharimonadales bacterium]